MTAPRTPRQTPGEGLVPLTIMVAPAEKAELATRARRLLRSTSYLGREAIVQYFEAHPTGETIPGR